MSETATETANTGSVCPFCKNPLLPGATKCMCGATYRLDQNGCLVSAGQLLIVGGSILVWGLVSILLMFLSTPGLMVFAVFAGGNYVTMMYGVKAFNKMFWKKSWHSQDTPNVIIHNRYQ